MADLSRYAGMKVLVTGGAGMIGSTIAHQLVAMDADVTILDAFLEPYGGNPANLEGIENRVHLVRADIRDDMTEYVRGQRVIFNLAGQVSHNDSMTDPFLDLDINYRGHVNVLEACRRENPGARLIHAGSRLQYGRILSNPVNESHPINPLTPYAANKQAAENYYLYCSRVAPRIESVCFRIANPYGPRSQMKHSKYSMICWFIRQAMAGGAITVFGDGSQVRDYIFVDDLAEAMITSGMHSFPTDGPLGHVFNVGCGAGARFIDMANTVVAAVGSGSVEPMDWPADYENVETGDYVTDITAVREALDWSPRVTLDDGIERTVRYYRDHGHKYFSR